MGASEVGLTQRLLAKEDSRGNYGSSTILFLLLPTCPVPCYPGIGDTHLPAGHHGPGAAGHGAWGTISSQKRRFQAKPRLRHKRPSVRPSVPSPGFPKQHSFMLAPPPPAAPAPQHTASFHRLCGPLVCLPCRVQALCCSPLFSPPPSKPSVGTQGVGTGGGLGSKAESRPGARSTRWSSRGGGGGRRRSQRGQHWKALSVWLSQQASESP